MPAVAYVVAYTASGKDTTAAGVVAVALVAVLTVVRLVRRESPRQAIAGLIGGTTTDWGLVAASAMVFAIPVLVFAFLVRKYLVAGVTLGAVRR